MLEKIMSMVKGEVSDIVSGVSGIPEGQKEATVETTASSLVDSLKKYVTGDNLSSLLSSFGKGGSGVSSHTASIERSVTSALTEKVGLQPDVARKIVSAVVPAVMSLFSKKVDDDNEPGFNLGSLLGGLTGKSAGSGGAGLGDMLGNLLGKKS